MSSRKQLSLGSLAWLIGVVIVVVLLQRAARSSSRQPASVLDAPSVDPEPMSTTTPETVTIPVAAG